MPRQSGGISYSPQWNYVGTGDTISLQTYNTLNGTFSMMLTKPLADLAYTKQFRQFPSVAPASLGGTTYDAFSIIVQFNSGRKAVIYREGASHVGGSGVLKIRYSNDGATWSAATTFLSESGIDVRNVSGGITPTGRLVVAYNRYEYGTSTFLGAYYVYSDDEGVTLSSQLTIQSGGVGTYGNLISIADNMLLLPIYSSGAAKVVISPNNGATWGSPITIATGGGFLYSEASLAYLGGSTIVGLIRDDNGTSRLTQVISTDNGVTWTNQGLVTFGVVEQVSPTLSTYIAPSGKLMVSCFYSDRVNGLLKVVSGGASEIIAGVSGWNASTLTTLATHPDNTSNSGYPSVIQNGTSQYVLGSYYEGNASITNIKFFIYPATSSLPISVGDMNITGDYMVNGVPIGAVGVTNVSSANSDLTVTSPTTNPVLTVNNAPTVTSIGNLTGDVASSNRATTLATVNSNVGSFGNATNTSAVTVNAKGLVTAASNTPIQIAESQVTNLTTDLASKYQSGDQPYFLNTTTAGGSASGGYYLNYQSDASSLPFRLVSENLAYQDFSIQRRSAKTSGSWESLLYWDASKNATFAGQVTAGSSSKVTGASGLNGVRLRLENTDGGGVSYDLVNGGTNIGNATDFHIRSNAGVNVLTITDAGNAEFPGTVKGDDAVNPTEFVTKQQMDAAVSGGRTLTVSTSASLTLATGVDYVKSSGGGTWTLPTPVGNVGNAYKITIKNRGGSTLTVASNSGTEIYGGIAASSVSVLTGGSLTLISDGTYWNEY